MQADQKTADTMNALARQSYEIALNMGDFDTEDSDGIWKVLRKIEFAQPLWDALGYGYKAKEYKERLRNRTFNRINAAVDVIKNIGNRPAQKRGWEKEVKRLEELLTILS